MPRQPGSAGWQQRGRHASLEWRRLNFDVSAEDVVRRIGRERARHDRQVAAGTRPLGVAMDERATTNDHHSSPVRRLARRHPIAMFLVIALSLSLPVMIAFLVSGRDVSPGALLGVIFLLGGAMLVTALSEGRAGVRRLFAGTIRWQMGVARFVVPVTAVPLLTLLVGALAGTLVSPPEGWLGLVGSYLFQTFIFGLLIVNLWEETAWRGFRSTHGHAWPADRIPAHRYPVLRVPHPARLRRTWFEHHLGPR